MVLVTDQRHLLELAAVQHGLVHRRQAKTSGLSRAALDHALRRGRWHSLPGGVLRLAGSPQTDHQVAMACVLAAGVDTALSHTSAAALWGLPGFRLVPAHATRLRRGGRR